MSREEYVGLVQDLCLELELGDAAELLDRGLLHVDDTLISIEYLEERDEIRLLADLGDIQDGVDRSALLELMLEANLGSASIYLPTFGVHPETGRQIVAFHMPLEVLIDKGIELAYVLREQLIPLLDEWRTTALDAPDDTRRS